MLAQGACGKQLPRVKRFVHFSTFSILPAVPMRCLAAWMMSAAWAKMHLALEADGEVHAVDPKLLSTRQVCGRMDRCSCTQLCSTVALRRE
mmetsp:Transcript_18382/g.40738  ORF Transcript_18382/g.40738 Transcript_18382/m.40738 type:complete len:91 (+) Transcript_18382:1-273(+)